MAIPSNLSRVCAHFLKLSLEGESQMQRNQHVKPHLAETPLAEVFYFCAFRSSIIYVYILMLGNLTVYSKNEFSP